MIIADDFCVVIKRVSGNKMRLNWNHLLNLQRISWLVSLPGSVFSFKLQYIVGFGFGQDDHLDQLNPKPTIYHNFTRIRAQVLWLFIHYLIIYTMYVHLSDLVIWNVIYTSLSILHLVHRINWIELNWTTLCPPPPKCESLPLLRNAQDKYICMSYMYC